MAIGVKELKPMKTTRKNRVKLLQNVGQYLVDHADTLVPQEEPIPTVQNLVVSMSDSGTPQITFYSQYAPKETIADIEWEWGAE